MKLSPTIGWVCLVLGALCIATGLVVAWTNRKVVPPAPPKAEVGDHGAIDETIKVMTDFAKALKDLDLSGKLLTVGVLLIAVAAVVAGLDGVAEAIKATAKT